MEKGCVSGSIPGHAQFSTTHPHVSMGIHGEPLVCRSAICMASPDHSGFQQPIKGYMHRGIHAKTSLPQASTLMHGGQSQEPPCFIGGRAYNAISPYLMSCGGEGT